MEFDYEVQYRAGALNNIADCLSRLPLPATDMDYTETVESVATILDDIQAVTQAHFKAESNSCPVLTKLCAKLQKPWPKQKKVLDHDLQPYYLIRDELAILDDCVIRGTHRLVVPGPLQKRLIDIAHNTHQVIVRTKQRLRELYWWPKMDAQVESLIKDCTT